jgi:hypothetical protein
VWIVFFLYFSPSPPPSHFFLFLSHFGGLQRGAKRDMKLWLLIVAMVGMSLCLSMIPRPRTLPQILLKLLRETVEISVVHCVLMDLVMEHLVVQTLWSREFVVYFVLAVGIGVWGVISMIAIGLTFKQLRRHLTRRTGPVVEAACAA